MLKHYICGSGLKLNWRSKGTESSVGSHICWSNSQAGGMRGHIGPHDASQPLHCTNHTCHTSCVAYTGYKDLSSTLLAPTPAPPPADCPQKAFHGSPCLGKQIGPHVTIQSGGFFLFAPCPVSRPCTLPYHCIEYSYELLGLTTVISHLPIRCLHKPAGIVTVGCWSVSEEEGAL